MKYFTHASHSKPHFIWLVSTGKSGNLGGRPKDEHRVSELARSFTAEAIETVVDLVRHGKDKRVRDTAAQALPDTGWGKAKLEEWYPAVRAGISSFCRLLTICPQNGNYALSDDDLF